MIYYYVIEEYIALEILFFVDLWASFLLRQDESGAMNYKKSGSWSWFFLKDQEPIFQDQEQSPNSRNIYFSIFCTKQGYGPTNH